MVSELVKALTASGFGLRGLKSWDSRGGIGTSFTLTYKGKPVAQARDEGCGGAWQLTWDGLRRDGTPVDPGTTRAQQAKVRNAVEAFAAFKTVIEAAVSSDGFPVDAGAALADLADLQEVVKMCKKNTVFTVPGDAPDRVRCLRGPYGPAAKKMILAQFPDAVIVNEALAGLLA